jgi:hypothetical protein
MKRIILFLLIFALAAPLVAEDAKPRQKGVLRTYIVPSYAFAFSAFDEDAKGGDADTIQVARLGLAAEYGLIDWLSLGIHWIPFWTFWSDFEQDDGLHSNGIHDIDIGVRFQLIGDKSLIVESEKVRLAATVAVVFPWASADWEDEADKQSSGDSYKATDPDKHAWGLGGRLYFDYVFTPAFFLNFYTEFIKFFNKDYEDVSLATYTASLSNGPRDYNYGWDLTFEIEPTLEYALTDAVEIGASLPINIKFTPDVSVDDSSVDDTATYLLKFGPELSLYLPKMFVPTEFRLFYLHPLLGRNSPATNEFGLYIQSHIRF